MPLTLVTGGPSAGKTGILHAEAVRAAHSGVPTILLPTAPDVSRARRELVLQKGLVSLRVEQIDRYLLGLWEIHGDGRTPVTPIQRSAMLRRAIKTSELSELTESVSTRGFLRIMERLASLMTGPVRTDGDGVAGEVARTLSTYREYLNSHSLIEAHEAVSILAQRAGSIAFDGPLLANRFDDLTAPQERFLTAAADTGADVWLAITGGAGAPATAATESLIERLRGVAQHEVKAEAEFTGSEELRAIERGLFDEDSSAEAHGDVVLSLAYGEEAEAERVTAEVIAAVRAGVDPGSIAVIYRETRRHHRAIARAFREARIPADFDMRLRFGETGYGRAVLTLLRFAATGRRTHLVSFLGSGYAGVRLDDADRLDALWRREGLSEGVGALLRALERMDAPTRRFVRSAVQMASTGVKPGNAEEWKSLAGAMLSNAYGREAPVLVPEAAGDAVAERRLCEAVDDLCGLDGMSCDSVGLYEVLSSAYVSPPVRERPGHVQVMDVERVRGRRFSMVVLAGLVTGEFPRQQHEGVFASGRLREDLESLGVVVPRDGGVEEERLLFYLGVTRARDRLVLSRQEADADGRPLRGSLLLDELLEMYGRRGDAAGMPLPPVRTLAFSDLGIHPAAPDLRRRALRTVAMSGADCDAPELARARARLSSPAPEIDDPDILTALAGRKSFTVTELESYLRCPCSWYFERFIAARPLEEEGEARLRGVLVHAVLERFYRGLRDEIGADRVGRSVLEPCLERATRLVDEVTAEASRESGVRGRLLQENVRSAALNTIARDATFLPGFTPTWFEWEFGGPDDSPEEFDGFALRGKIDRIDTNAEAFVVVDYKTGGLKPVARFEPEGLLQAPLYAEVVRRRLGLTIAASVYRGVTARDGKGQSRGFYDPELVSGIEFVSTDGKADLDAVIGSATLRAAEAAEGIRRGAVPRQPLCEAACTYCKARSWCTEAMR